MKHKDMLTTFHDIGVWCIIRGSIARSIRHHGDVFGDHGDGDDDDGGDDDDNDDGDDGGDDGGDASSEPALLPPCAPQR